MILGHSDPLVDVKQVELDRYTALLHPVSLIQKCGR